MRRWLHRGVRAAVWLTAAAGAFLAYVLFPASRPQLTFPEGKRFALTIVDDTDQTTLERAKPLYEVLERAGLRTTKTVWSLPTAPDNVPTDQGVALTDPDYRAWILELH